MSKLRKRGAPSSKSGTLPGVLLTRGHGEDLSGLYHKRRQGATVYASGIESKCVRCAARLFRWPMAEQNRLRPAIDGIPGKAAAPRRVSSHGANLSHVAGHLLVQINAGPNACVHD